MAKKRRDCPQCGSSVNDKGECAYGTFDSCWQGGQGVQHPHLREDRRVSCARYARNPPVQAHLTIDGGGLLGNAVVRMEWRYSATLTHGGRMELATLDYLCSLAEV